MPAGRRKKKLNPAQRDHYHLWQIYAYRKTKAAIRCGKLAPVKGRRCEDCGEPAIAYDHRDYSRPLMVEPVCTGCNIRRGRGHVPVYPPPSRERVSNGIALRWRVEPHKPTDLEERQLSGRIGMFDALKMA